MRYLLDTHAVLWCFEHSGKLSQKAKEIIIDPQNIVYLTA